MKPWRFWLRQWFRRIWFRAALISALSVLLALASVWLAPLVPYEFSLKVGSDAADNILGILASSMLAVTTFSLAAMVAAFSRAAQHVTPRATQLLIEDKTAQNALSTFLGAFLFAIVGMIALSTGSYGAQGRVILLFGTVVLIFWIAVILLRWIDTLTEFGRVEDAIRRIEKATAAAIDRHCGPILLAGRAEIAPPAGAAFIVARATGYVTAVDRESLGACAADCDATVQVYAAPGTMVSRGLALAWTTTELDEERLHRMAAAFAISPERSFDEDPRFGMTVLAEVASRALSPAINDPGTAILVLNAGQRAIEALADACPKPTGGTTLVEPPLELAAMLDDLILPIARDAASLAEVGIPLQQMLGALAVKIPEASGTLRGLAVDALKRAGQAGLADTDLERIRQAHRSAFH